MPTRTVTRSALALVAALFLSAAAHAQVFRAYLAPTGSDANPCTLPLPCRLLPAALNAVASGGEIWILDSANYNTGTVNIAKSVTILAVPGVVGSVVASDGPAIAVTTSNHSVTLRNLVIVPLAGCATCTHGIVLQGLSNLTIEDSVIARLPGNGVLVGTGGFARVVNTTVQACGDAGVRVGNNSRDAVSRARLLGNAAVGVVAEAQAGSFTQAVISDSVFDGGDGTGANIGAWAFADGNFAFAQVEVTRSSFAGGSAGVQASTGTGSATAILAISQSLVSAGTHAWVAAGSGMIQSYGNNHIVGLGSGTLSPIALR